MAFFKELPTDRRIDLCKVAEEDFSPVIGLKEVEALALSVQNSKALDVVEDQTRQVWVRAVELLLTLSCIKLEFINSVLEDLGRSLNIILQQQSAAEQIVSFQLVASDSLTQLIQLVDDLVEIGLHSALINLWNKKINQKSSVKKMTRLDKIAIKAQLHTWIQT